MRVEGDFIVINKWLLPLSWLYGLGVKLRNFAFEAGILKSRAFDVPVISVGNITVGGTGKTPHVEYLTKLLRELFHVAVLSRGYKRKTRGFIIADKNTTMPEIGDEPFQMKQKFPDVTVAVDKKRCHRTGCHPAGRCLPTSLRQARYQYPFGGLSPTGHLRHTATGRTSARTTGGQEPR